MSAKLSTQAEYEALLNNYDTWLFDCDGVLWRGDHLLDGVIQVLDMLRRRSRSEVSIRLMQQTKMSFSCVTGLSCQR